MKRLIQRQASNQPELILGLERVISNPKFKQYILEKAEEFAADQFENNWDDITSNEVLEKLHDELLNNVEGIIEYFIDELADAVEEETGIEVGDGEVFYNTPQTIKEQFIEIIEDTFYNDLMKVIDETEEEVYAE